MHNSWARLASFCHLGFISDPLIVSKFHNEIHDPKWQENKIYTIVKFRETFYRRLTVQVTSCSEVKYVLKWVSFGSKDCTKNWKTDKHAADCSKAVCWGVKWSMWDVYLKKLIWRLHLSEYLYFTLIQDRRHSKTLILSANIYQNS